MAALILNLDFSTVFLIGHSMGCQVVLEAARLLPKRVAGVVLIDGSRAPAEPPPIKNYAALAENLFRQRSSATFGAELWSRMARCDATSMERALATVRGCILAIQSTMRNAQLQRSPMKTGDTSPWLKLLPARSAAARQPTDCRILPLKREPSARRHHRKP